MEYHTVIQVALKYFQNLSQMIFDVSDFVKC
jgi:hypothetical protein